MIPKIIHYCWFGKNKLDETSLRCLESWKKFAPDFEIKEWNENNFDVNAQPFTAKMYQRKLWAFVSDYARLDILEKEGGIYLDTDVLMVKSPTPLLDSDLFMGEEETGIINAAIIGAKPHQPFIAICREYYDTDTNDSQTIPRVLTKLFSQYPDKKSITIYPPVAFYPFKAEEIKDIEKLSISPETYAIHLWNYSWGHPLNKFFKKIGVHAFGKKLSEKLGIKNIIKKIFNFI